MGTSLVWLMADEQSSNEIADLSQLYTLLQQDAKLLVTDLRDGVSMWNSAGRLMVYLSLLGFFLAYLNQFPQTPLGVWKAVGLISALALGVAGAIGYFFTHRKYSKLVRKYRELFRLAEKLS